MVIIIDYSLLSSKHILPQKVMLFNQYYNLYAEVKVHLVKFDCQFIKIIC